MTPRELIASVESRLEVIHSQNYGTEVDVASLEIQLAIAKMYAMDNSFIPNDAVREDF